MDMERFFNAPVAYGHFKMSEHSRILQHVFVFRAFNTEQRLIQQKEFQMRFPPIVPLQPDTQDPIETSQRMRRSKWPAISALISSLLGLLSSLIGCDADSNTPDDTRTVETAPAPDDEILDDPAAPNDTNSTADSNQSTDLPNMDEATDDEPPPP